eukprot:2364728-Amphidinium_carterae.2
MLKRTLYNMHTVAIKFFEFNHTVLVQLKHLMKAWSGLQKLDSTFGFGSSASNSSQRSSGNYGYDRLGRSASRGVLGTPKAPKRTACFAF